MWCHSSCSRFWSNCCFCSRSITVLFQQNEREWEFWGQRVPKRGSGSGFYFRETSNLLSGDVSQGANGGRNMFFGFSYSTPMNSKAGYAQASYQLTSQLKLTGGFRYTADYKASSGYFGDITGGIIFANQAGSASFSKSKSALPARACATTSGGEAR